RFRPALAEAPGDEDVITLGRIAVALEKVACPHDLLGLQSCLFQQFAARHRQRLRLRSLLPAALRQFPEARADRIAVLLDEMQSTVARDRHDDGKVGLLDHAIDAMAAVAPLNRILPHAHPAVLVDDTAIQLLYVEICAHRYAPAKAKEASLPCTGTYCPLRRNCRRPRPQCLYAGSAPASCSKSDEAEQVWV